MIRLIYVSSATQLMSEADLIHLLDQARNRNERLNVTGMLLYAEGNFIQVLEGKAENVEEIFESILNDDRNEGTIVIEKENIKERDFADWSMGFRNLTNDKGTLTKGYSNFLDSKMTQEEININSNEIIGLLYQFKKYS